jgi:hypothetical protein
MLQVYSVTVKATERNDHHTHTHTEDEYNVKAVTETKIGGGKSTWEV